MDELTVRSTESGTFLDRVVAHAVHHEILSKNRRRRLSEQCAEYFPYFCDKFNARVAAEEAVDDPLFGAQSINPQSIDEALKASKTIADLLSVGLEIKSHGDVAFAANVLAKNSVAEIIDLVWDRTARLTERAANLRQRCKARFEIPHPKIVRDIVVRFARYPREIAPAARTSAQIETVKLSVFLRDLREHRDLVETEALLERWEKELEASLKFLPWRELKEAFKLRLLPPDSVTVEEEGDWSLAMLLLTLSVTLQIKGRGRGKTIVSWDNLRRFVGALCDDESRQKFRRRTLRAAREYLASRTPRPNESETALLLSVWDWAFDDLAYFLPKGKHRYDVHAWSHKVFLDSWKNPRLLLSTTPGMSGTLSEADGLSRAEREDRAITRRYFESFDWGLIVKMGEVDGVTQMRGLLETFTPAVVIPYLPFDPRVIGFFLDGGGARRESEARSLIRRLLAEAPQAFWRDTPDTLALELQRAASLPQLKRLQRLLPAKSVEQFRDEAAARRAERTQRGRQIVEDIRSGKPIKEVLDPKRQ